MDYALATYPKRSPLDGMARKRTAKSGTAFFARFILGSFTFTARPATTSTADRSP